jgi:GR25 family glycosyltransferase involved in LPS biosynthesis
MFIIMVLIIVIFYVLNKYNCSKKIEKFKLINNIDYYVITMKNKNRIDNIEKQTDIINKSSNGNKINIEKVDAVIGIATNMDELVKNKTLSEEYVENTNRRKGQIGCYLSHLKIYNMINYNNKNKGYSIIFEDDFEIRTDNFINNVNNALNVLKNEDFDLLFLQNNSDIVDGGKHEKNHGILLNDNVYFFNKKQLLYGTLAILVNNKNIKKILNNLKIINEPIDKRFENLAMNDKLKIMLLYPDIVDQQKDILSIIDV